MVNKGRRLYMQAHMAPQADSANAHTPETESRLVYTSGLMPTRPLWGTATAPSHDDGGTQEHPPLTCCRIRPALRSAVEAALPSRCCCWEATMLRRRSSVIFICSTAAWSSSWLGVFGSLKVKGWGMRSMLVAHFFLLQ